MKVVDPQNLGQVFDIIDDLEGKSHCVIFYEEPEYARMVEYHFIQTGLLKGESCIYVTHEDEIRIIESGMADFGIDVEGYKKNKMLHFYQITEPRSDLRYLLHEIEWLRKCVMTDSKPPFRLVSRWMKNVDGEEGQHANMVVEKRVRSNFERYQGSVMCPYQVKDIKAAMKEAWMQNHLRNHHAVIFILKDGEGLAFNLPAQFSL
jgi:MEDS: MEthanogen/methylotroph, DcmR Sensory domain